MRKKTYETEEHQNLNLEGYSEDRWIIHCDVVTQINI